MSTPRSNITTTSKLLIEVAKNVEVFGEQHTHNLLYKERTKNLVQQHLNFVINMVCSHMDISSEQVINQKGREYNKRILALKFISYYCYESFKKYEVSFSVIGSVVQRRKSLVFKHHSDISENRKDKSKDNDYNQKLFKHFDAEVAKYIKSIKHTKK